MRSTWWLIPALLAAALAATPQQRSRPGQHAIMEENTDRPGGDYRDFEIRSGAPRACMEACVADARCRAWTLLKPPEAGAPARCYLKESVPEPVESDCCVSGVSSASGGGRQVLRPGGGSSTIEQNTDRFGGDYRDFDLARAEPAACQAVCLQEAECKAWTYTRPGGPGEKAHCYLKNEVTPPRRDDCCVSGVKR